MMAFAVVLLTMLLLLGLVYGLGGLWFAWWDGGLMRRLLIAACVLSVLAAARLFVERHPQMF